jgi:acyl-coenzyme A thioesterase PaaI-like protein
MTNRTGHDELLSIQQRLYPQASCFGCGPNNSKGLQLRSYACDGGVVATFEPWPQHDNGVGYLNGGIISTLLDCHSAAAVFLEAAKHGWTALPATMLPFLTAGLDVRFLRPAPLHGPVELRGAVLHASEPEITTEVQLVANDRTRATAIATWRRWRPRHLQY